MSQVFRLFISSTFQDWHPEREYLREYIFPRLKKLCNSRGARFLPIDLRWGISEEAGKTHDTVNICLEEIKRCQAMNTKPNFLVFMGNRYGWRPVPAILTSTDKKSGKVGQWERLQRLGVISETNDLFHDWYEKDENAVPPEYVLRPTTDENTGRRGAWVDAEKRLRKLLDDSYFPKKIGSPNPKWLCNEKGFTEDELAFLVGSVTEQEIVCGALGVKNANAHVHTFVRDLSGDITVNAYADSGSPEELKLIETRRIGIMERLRKFLNKENFHDDKAYQLAYSEEIGRGEREGYYLNKLGEDVFSALSKIIEKELAKDSAVEEVEAPEIKYFVGLKSKVEKVINHNGSPLIVYGKPGSGKSTLLSKSAERLQRLSRNVLSYWVGRDPKCASGEGLLRSILFDLKYHDWVDTGEGFKWEPIEVKGFYELSFYLSTALSYLKEEVKGKLSIIIDAVDQLPEGDLAKEVDWISEDAPIVLSTLDEKTYKKFCVKFSCKKRQLVLGRMRRNSARALLEKWQKSDSRQLQKGQKAAVLKAFSESGLPLHLRVLYDDAKSWKSSYVVEPKHLPKSSNEAISFLYNRLSDAHGSVMLQRTLGYFVAGQHGLSEEELLKLLRNDEHVVASFRHRSPQSPSVDTLPEIIWSRLYHDLEPFLARRFLQGEQLLDFYHMQFRRVAEQGDKEQEVGPWLSDDILQDCRKRLAGMMLKEWGLNNKTARSRVFYEVCALLKKAESNDSLFSLVRDKSFLDQQENLAMYLPLDSLQIALLVALEIGNPSEISTLLIRHAERLKTISEYASVKYFKDGDLESILKNLDVFDSSTQIEIKILAAWLYARNNNFNMSEILVRSLPDISEIKISVHSGKFLSDLLLEYGLLSNADECLVSLPQVQDGIRRKICNKVSSDTVDDKLTLIEFIYKPIKKIEMLLIIGGDEKYHTNLVYQAFLIANNLPEDNPISIFDKGNALVDILKVKARFNALEESDKESLNRLIKSVIDPRLKILLRGREAEVLSLNNEKKLANKLLKEVCSSLEKLDFKDRDRTKAELVVYLSKDSWKVAQSLLESMSRYLQIDSAIENIIEYIPSNSTSIEESTVLVEKVRNKSAKIKVASIVIGKGLLSSNYVQALIGETQSTIINHIESDNKLNSTYDVLISSTRLYDALVNSKEFVNEADAFYVWLKNLLNRDKLDNADKFNLLIHLALIASGQGLERSLNCLQEALSLLNADEAIKNRSFKYSLVALTAADLNADKDFILDVFSLAIKSVLGTKNKNNVDYELSALSLCLNAAGQPKESIKYCEKISNSTVRLNTTYSISNLANIDDRLRVLKEAMKTHKDMAVNLFANAIIGENPSSHIGVNEIYRWSCILSQVFSGGYNLIHTEEVRGFLSLDSLSEYISRVVPMCIGFANSGMEREELENILGNIDDKLEEGYCFSDKDDLRCEIADAYASIGSYKQASGIRERVLFDVLEIIERAEGCGSVDTSQSYYLKAIRILSRCWAFNQVIELVEKVHSNVDSVYCSLVQSFIRANGFNQALEALENINNKAKYNDLLLTLLVKISQLDKGYVPKNVFHRLEGLVCSSPIDYRLLNLFFQALMKHEKIEASNVINLLKPSEMSRESILIASEKIDGWFLDSASELSRSVITAYAGIEALIKIYPDKSSEIFKPIIEDLSILSS